MILSIDTSSKSASCALTDGCDVVAESFCNAGITHSATMMPMIEDIFKCCGKSMADVTMFAATAGPGSFTGVRIGASILLGLAVGKGLPCVGVSTLEVLANPFRQGFDGAVICPVLDARRGQFYNALFKDGQRITPDRAISAQELDTELSALGAPVILCGDGYRLASSLLTYDKITAVPQRLVYPSAAEAARLAYDKYNAAQDKSVFTDLNFKPVYLRPSQAERVLKNKAENDKENI